MTKGGPDSSNARIMTLALHVRFAYHRCWARDGAVRESLHDMAHRHIHTDNQTTGQTHTHTHKHEQTQGTTYSMVVPVTMVPYFMYDKVPTVP